MSMPARSDSLSTILPPDLASGSAFELGAVPDRDVVAGLQEPLGHRIAHAAHADPSDPLRVLRHNQLPLSEPCTAIVLLARPRAGRQCAQIAWCGARTAVIISRHASSCSFWVLFCSPPAAARLRRSRRRRATPPRRWPAPGSSPTPTATRPAPSRCGRSGRGRHAGGIRPGLRRQVSVHRRDRRPGRSPRTTSSGWSIPRAVRCWSSTRSRAASMKRRGRARAFCSSRMPAPPGRRRAPPRRSPANGPSCAAPASRSAR